LSDELAGGSELTPARTVFRHSVMTFGSRVAIVLVNVPTSIMIARLLGTDGQGTYASAVTFPTMFAFIGMLGFDTAHTFLLSKRRCSLGEVVGQSLVITAILSAIVTPLYLFFVSRYDGASEPSLAHILRLAAILIPALLAKYFSVSFFLGLRKIRTFNLINLAQAAALLVFMSVNLFVLGGGAVGALVAYVASEALVTVVTVVALVRGEERPIVSRPAPGMFRKSFVYGLQGHVGSVLTQFTYRFDMFLVLSMLGLRAQGLYSISVILAEKLSHIPQSINVVLFPQVSSMSSDEANALTPRVTRNSLFVVFVAGLIMYLVSRPLLLLLYGTEFLPALRAFQILIPGIVALSIAKILSSDLSGRDRRIYHTIATAVAFAVNIGLCLLWIPDMGIVGAAWASTVAYAVQSGLMLVFFVRLSGCGVAETVLIRGEDLSLYGGLVRRAVRRRRQG
jgi:O-antigen/teichoic acid export membrane protein